MLRIAVVQQDIKLFRQRDNIDKTHQLIKDIDADIFVLPELYDTGYLFNSREEAMNNIEEFEENPGLEFIKQISKKKKCIVYAGIAEKKRHKLFNSAIFVNNGDLIEVYRKKHLFNTEKEIFDKDHSPLRVIHVNGVRFGLMICFDWIFPEMARSLTRLGSQVILHCANLVLPFCPNSMITRSVENRVYSITSNRTGVDINKDKKAEFIGSSQCISPSGEIHFRAGREEGVFITDIDPKLSDNKSINPYNDLLNDLRDDLYC
jgi:predicted amidohydrolase